MCEKHLPSDATIRESGIRKSHEKRTSSSGSCNRQVATTAIDRPYLQSGKDEMFGNNLIAHIFSIIRFAFLLGTTVTLKE
ncbi:unnamed protein product [Clavelina lepadiformis]|uniref:Uncharacterized protein n=1 Tax=Clavelina lepadiformis TaxID=159417 RepID=A0ABP0FYX6_CLALP